MADEDPLKIHRDLLIACGWGKEIDVILLLQQGGSVRVQDQDGKNCLHYSACKGHIQVTNLLIEKGCSINARDKGNRSPLHLAAEEGHHDIVSILLDTNAEFNVQDEEGNTPCHVACINDHFEVIELLAHVQADLNARNKDGYSPLHIATINSHVNSMSLLISAGAKTSTQDLNGNTAAHLAAQMKSLKALRCLIKHGVDINIQNYDGDTALHICADNGSTQLVQCILNGEQPVELSPNNVGDSAKDVAISRGFKDIVQLIPDPFRKRRSRRKVRTSESAASPSNSVASPTTSLPELDDANAHRKHRYDRSPPRSSFLQHPSEELPTGTSSSMLSLWVPTTDSGISLPLDVRLDRVGYSSGRRKKHREEHLLGDKHDKRLKSKDEQKYDRHSKKWKMKTYEYEELRMDPLFTSPRLIKKHKIEKQKKGPKVVQSGAQSDESVQYKGCFPKKSSKSRSNSVKLRQTSNEKETMIQRQTELQYQLNDSKMALEKQMRRMRKKFERALRATDEKFLEQKRREETYHSQLKTELEIIEKSLERGSKKNVEEFSQHIKNELNNLAEKLTRGVDNCAEETKKRNRASFVDLDRKISVSLSKDVNNSVKLRRKEKWEGQSSSDVIETYEHRLKQLERDAQEKSIREHENETLRARVIELEKLVIAAKGDT